MDTQSAGFKMKHFERMRRHAHRKTKLSKKWYIQKLEETAKVQKTFVSPLPLPSPAPKLLLPATQDHRHHPSLLAMLQEWCLVFLLAEPLWLPELSVFLEFDVKSFMSKSIFLKMVDMWPRVTLPNCKTKCCETFWNQLPGTVCKFTCCTKWSARQTAQVWDAVSFIAAQHNLFKAFFLSIFLACFYQQQPPHRLFAACQVTT